MDIAFASNGFGTSYHAVDLLAMPASLTRRYMASNRKATVQRLTSVVVLSPQVLIGDTVICVIHAARVAVRPAVI